MTATLTREQVREIDRRATEELGIPGIVLMENAGLNCANAILDIMEGEMQLFAQDAVVVVLCGGGNNGGDGYVIARHLSNIGVKVTAVAVVDPATLTGDAAVHANIALKMNLVVPGFDGERWSAVLDTLAKPHLVVDAMLGTGFHGQVRDHVATVISQCNQWREQEVTVVAVDVPSGLDCNSGESGGAVVQADVTVTFVAVKRGFVEPQAQPYLGRVLVAEIGVPPGLVRQVLAG